MSDGGATLPTCAPPKAEIATPAFVFPADSCDSHCHIFGPDDRFPLSPKRTYNPAACPKESLAALHRKLGIAYAVLVQPACYGSDHSAMLDALESGGGRYRGVGIVAPDTPDAELERLHKAGMRGARFNFVPHLGAPPAMDDLRRVAERVAPLGWHLAIHIAAEDLAKFTGIFSLGLPMVIDHMARIKAAGGAGQPAFQTLLAVLRGENCWVKVSGADRASDGRSRFQDAVPLARALAEAAPDRVLWGTDWPHPNVVAVPDDGELVDLIPEIAPDAAARHKMLVANPARLFGFAHV